jgi:DNA adenine methylase
MTLADLAKAARTAPTEVVPDTPCLPFLKWPGGKRWIAKELSEIIQTCLAPGGTYFEPFLGGGAVFFHLRPTNAVLGDLNADLIETYLTIRTNTPQVLRSLRRWPATHESYYRIRSSRPKSSVGRAARFLYLNRNAFGGVYRLNEKGEFNVPFGGRGHSILWKTKLLSDAASALSTATLLNADFAQVMAKSGRGDVVFCDPTYTVAHDNNGFVRYNERNFSWLDQVRLASEAKLAAARGAMVFVSNAHHSSVRALYEGSAMAITLSRLSRVSRKLAGRGLVKEYLFVLTPLSCRSDPIPKGKARG